MTKLIGRETIDRKKILLSKEYWMERIQNLLYTKVDEYLERENMSKTAFARQLGCSRSYVTQILNGESDHRLSKMIEVLLAIGITPEIPMERSLNEFLRDDHYGHSYTNSSTRALNTSNIKYSLAEASILTKPQLPTEWPNREKKSNHESFKNTCFTVATYQK